MMSKLCAINDEISCKTYEEINEIKQSTYNKCYVLIKELIRSTNEKNKDTFFIKYKKPV